MEEALGHPTFHTCMPKRPCLFAMPQHWLRSLFCVYESLNHTAPGFILFSLTYTMQEEQGVLHPNLSFGFLETAAPHPMRRLAFKRGQSRPAYERHLHVRDVPLPGPGLRGGSNSSRAPAQCLLANQGKVLLRSDSSLSAAFCSLSEDIVCIFTMF